jgi:hypothetical protein
VIQQTSEPPAEQQSFHQYSLFIAASTSAELSSSSTPPMSGQVPNEPPYLDIREVYHSTMTRRYPNEKNRVRNIPNESETETQLAAMEAEMLQWQARRDAEAEGNQSTPERPFVNEESNEDDLDIPEIGNLRIKD